jgi:hypothetical protein
MTLNSMTGTASRGQCQGDITDEILGETPSLGNFFAAAPPSNPPPIDDALAIERADNWIFSERSPEAAGDECFPTAVAVATILREQGLPLAFAQDRVERWCLFACSPRLEQADIDLAVREAYSRPLPVAAVKPVQPSAPTAAAPPQPGGLSAPAPSFAAAEGVDGTSPLDPSFAYVVIDINPRRGGMDTFSALAQKLPKTMRATCANPLTGTHEGDRIVLKSQPGMRIKQRKLGRGVVVKSCDASAVLDGHKLANSRPPAYAPQWLANEFEGESSAPHSVAPEGTPELDDENASVNTEITKTTRRVGRPTGRTKDKPFQMRVNDAFITKIDDWRRQQPDFPNRTESVRRLVEQALNGKRG